MNMIRDEIIQMLEDMDEAYKTSARTCEHCGIVHFNNAANEQNAGNYGAFAHVYPDRYIGHGDGSVIYFVYNNQSFIPRCACNTSVKLVKNLWNDRKFITEVLTTLAESAKEQAMRDEKIYERMEGDLSTLVQP